MNDGAWHLLSRVTLLVPKTGAGWNRSCILILSIWKHPFPHQKQTILRVSRYILSWNDDGGGSWTNDVAHEDVVDHHVRRVSLHVWWFSNDPETLDGDDLVPSCLKQVQRTVDAISRDASWGSKTTHATVACCEAPICRRLDACPSKIQYLEL